MARTFLLLPCLLLGCVVPDHPVHPGNLRPPPRLDEEPETVEVLREIARLEDAKVRDGRLVALLEHASPTVRLAAVRALAHIRHAGDAAALAGRFEDPDPRVVRAALFATGLLTDGEERAPAGPVLPLLEHMAFEVRADAVEALGRIGDPATVDAVVACLQDGSALVRGEAALACWRLQLAQPARDVADSTSVAIAERVHATVLAIAAQLAIEEEADARWKQVYAIASLRRDPPRSGPAPGPLSDRQQAALRTVVAACFEDADWRVRTFAALAVRRLWAEEAHEVALPLLSDPSWKVRCYALTGLGASRAAATSAAFRRSASEDPHPLVRATALSNLGSRNDTALVRLARAALEDPSPSVRRAAFPLYAASAKLSALAALEAAFAADDPFTRAAAISAIGQALPEEASDEERARVAELLQRVPDGVHEAAAALEACRGLPIELARFHITRACASEELEVVGTMASLVQDRADELKADEGLFALLQTAWDGAQEPAEYELRQELIACFVALELAEAKELLRAALAEDPVRAVREAARDGLAALGEEGLEVPALAALPAPDERPDPALAHTEELPRWLRIETSKGEMILELYRTDAPMHVHNLVTLARAGFYDGLPFHRVVPGFVIQGGDPRGTGWGDPGYTLNNEVNPRRYVHGTVGMPDAGLDTGGCQIFVNHLPTPHLDGRYTVFARVAEGLDVVDRIEVGDVIEKVVVVD